MLKVGSKFYTFDELSRKLEEFQQIQQVQLWVRDSRTVVAAAKRARRKSLNPALKYAELTYSCVFGGRRPSDQTKTHNQTSAGGCPFKVRLSTSNDGQALVVKEICHDHNHEPGKKLHEEPRRLYRNKANNRSGVRRPIRCVVNKQQLESRSETPSSLPPKAHHTQAESVTSVRLAQSPFHHLQLHNQQQQLQIKLQLEQHLQQQRIRQQQLEEVIQLDSPDHIDTPDHLSSPDLLNSFEFIGNLVTAPDQYSYLPPSPISPSSSVSSNGQVGYTSEEEGAVEPIVDLDVALEEALGDLESVSSMDVEDKFALIPLGSSRTVVQSSDNEPSLTALPLPSSPATSHVLASQHDEDPCAPPPAKKFKGRPRKHSTGSHSLHAAEEESDFIGFSPVKSQDTGSIDHVSEDDIAEANAMAKQLHVYKPGIDFVAGAKLEVLDSRDNNWYQCKIVEVDWGELDILVHYERWSVRFDEWLKMDSTRIRSLMRATSQSDSQFLPRLDDITFFSPRSEKKTPFKAGEKVLGFWNLDAKYYPGEIIKQTSEDFYEVLFYDGYTKSLRSSQLKKMQGKDLEAFKDSPVGNPKAINPPISSPGPSHVETRRRSSGAISGPSTVELHSPPITPDLSEEGGKSPQKGQKGWTYVPELDKKNIFSVEILDEKRKTRRKPDVEELFKSLKRKRKLEEMLEDSKPTSPNIEEQPRWKQETEEPQKPEEVEHKTEEFISTPPEKSHAPTDQISYIKEKPLKLDWNHIEIDMGYQWKKVSSKRAGCSQWDTYYITPNGRKIKTRLQFTKAVAEHYCPITIHEVDFSYKTARLEYEAKYGGVSIMTDPGTPSAQSEASFSEIYKAADPPSSKKLKIGTVEETKTALTKLEKSDDDTASSSSSSSNDNDEDKDNSSGSEDEDDEKSRVSSVQDEKYEMSSRGDDESSASEGYEVENVPSVRLSEFMPQTKSKSPTPTKEKIVSSPNVESPSKGIYEGVTRGTTKASPIASLPAEATPATVEKVIIRRRVRKRELVAATPDDVTHKSENSHKCPKKSCEKSFRKENLLQMHMKHYHPELMKKKSLQAPNVADLAYARTVGDHLDSASPSSSSPYAFSPASYVSSEATKQDQPIATRKSSRHSIESKKSKKQEVSNSERLSEYSSHSEEEDELEEDLKAAAPTSAIVEGVIEAPKMFPMKTKERQQSEKKLSRSESSYGKRTRKSDSVSEPAETEDEPVDVTGEAQSEEYQDAIINCVCKSVEEDGLMLQCDICMCWQHGGCYNIEREDQVPDTYICSLCENPKGQRSSMRYRHHQDWLKEAKLPRFSFATDKPNTKLQSFIKRGHELSANVLQLSQLMHSLRLKLSISKEADHPKFVMWHKKWEEQLDDGYHVLEHGDQLPSVSLVEDHRGGSNVNSELPAQGVLSFATTHTSETSVGEETLPGTSTVEKSQDNRLIAATPFIQSIAENSQRSPQPVVSDIAFTSHISSGIICSDIVSGIVASPPTVALSGNTVIPVMETPMKDDSNQESVSQSVNLDVRDLPVVCSTRIPSHTTEQPIGHLPCDMSQMRDTNTDFPASEMAPTTRISADLIPQVSDTKFMATSDEILEQDVEHIKSIASKTCDLAQDILPTLPDLSVDAQTVAHSQGTDADLQSKISEAKVQDLCVVSKAESEPIVDVNASAAMEHKTVLKDEMPLSTSCPVEMSTTETDINSAALGSDGNIRKGDQSSVALEDRTVAKELKDSAKYISAALVAEPSSSLDDKSSIVKQEDTQLKSVPSTCQPLYEVKKEEKNGVLFASHLVGTSETKVPTSFYENITAECNIAGISVTRDLTAKDNKVMQSTATTVASSTEDANEACRNQLDDKSKLDLMIKSQSEYPGESASQVSLEDADDFDGADLEDLLSHSSLEHFVDQASKELAPQAVAPIIPQAERIEPVNCKLNLLQHIEATQNKVSKRFDFIERELQALEAEMGLTSEISKEEEELLRNDESEERDAATLQSRSLLKVILNDLEIVKKIADFSSSKDIH